LLLLCYLETVTFVSLKTKLQILFLLSSFARNLSTVKNHAP
jgi:hypothetical protein